MKTFRNYLCENEHTSLYQELEQHFNMMLESLEKEYKQKAWNLTGEAKKQVMNDVSHHLNLIIEKYHKFNF